MLFMSMTLMTLLGCPVADPDVVPPDPATTPTPPVPWTPTVVEVGDRSVTVETLSVDSTGSAVPLFPADVLAVVGDEVHRFDPFGLSELFAFNLPGLVAAEPWGEGFLLVTEEGLVAYDSGLVSTPLDDLVAGVADVVSLTSGLWLDTSEGLVVVRDDVASAITVDGVQGQGFARGFAGTGNQLPVLWTAVGDRAVAVNFADDALVSFEAFTFFGEVDAVAATSGGRVLVLVEGWVVERASPTEWVRLDFGAAVREIRGQRGADSLWVRTDTEWIHGGETWEATDVPVDVPMADDRFGRLVAADENGVRRYAVGLPVLLLDVPEDNVLTTATVRVVPTAPDLAPTLTVTATSVTGTVEALVVEDYAVVLDAEVLEDGPWTLEATADYGTETSTASATVLMGADFEPTFGDHIAPIFSTQCTPCHEGDQGIISLATEADWLTNMEEGSTPGSLGILDRIRIDNMPSDTRQLSETQKYLVETWWELQP